MSMFLMGGLLIAVVVAGCVLALTMGRSAALVCALAGLVLVGATFYEAQLSDRWASSNITAEQLAEQFANVPSQIGDWVGEDQAVNDQVREVAGAVGCVSREYTNSVTGDKVNLWLIVGHSRDVCRHTPDICYPSSGYHTQSQENVRHTIALDGRDPANFWTNSFIKENVAGRALERVFWTWHKPDDDGLVKWQAPDYQRFHFGNTRALYKMYLMSSMSTAQETADESICIDFAEQFLPELEKVLSQDPSLPSETETPA